MVDFEHKKAANKLDFFLDLSIVVGFVGICKGWDSPLKFFFDWTNTSNLGYQEFLLETYCQDMNFGLSSPHYSLTPCLILPRQCFHLFTAWQYHFHLLPVHHSLSGKQSLIIHFQQKYILCTNPQCSYMPV